MFLWQDGVRIWVLGYNYFKAKPQKYPVLRPLRRVKESVVLQAGQAIEAALAS
jgi:hypothetical protein